MCIHIYNRKYWPGGGNEKIVYWITYSLDQDSRGMRYFFSSTPHNVTTTSKSQIASIFW